MPRPKKKWAPRQERKKARLNKQTEAQAAPFDGSSGAQLLPETSQNEVWTREGHKVGGQSKKRARASMDEELGHPPKSKRSRNAQDAEGDSNPEAHAAAAGAAAASAYEMPFYGLLNQEEQDYFSRANEMLEVNQFGSDEGKAGSRSLFFSALHLRRGCHHRKTNSLWYLSERQDSLHRQRISGGQGQGAEDGMQLISVQAYGAAGSAIVASPDEGFVWGVQWAVSFHHLDVRAQRRDELFFFFAR
jgi:hypothetical protein